MIHVVILIETDQVDIQVFGPYPDPHSAEMARRRIHMEARKTVGAHQFFPGRIPRAYVRQMRHESALALTAARP